MSKKRHESAHVRAIILCMIEKFGSVTTAEIKANPALVIDPERVCGFLSAMVRYNLIEGEPIGRDANGNLLQRYTIAGRKKPEPPKPAASAGIWGLWKVSH